MWLPVALLGAPRVAAARPTGAWRRHLNLTRELAVTQFKLKYTGSVLGYVWSAFKPGMYFAILYVVFVDLLHASSRSPNFPVQLLLGIVLFTFFQETTGASVNAIAGNGHIIRKAYFPRVILIIAATLSACITFAINLTLVVIIAAAIGNLDLGLRSLAMIPLLIELYALILGIGLFLSAVFVFYRDVGHFWEIITQLLLYAAGVVFPLDIAFGHRFLEKLLLMNPMGQIVEDARHAIASGSPEVPWSFHELGILEVVPLGLVVLALVGGSLVFRRLTPRFAESL